VIHKYDAIISYNLYIEKASFLNVPECFIHLARGFFHNKSCCKDNKYKYYFQLNHDNFLSYVWTKLNYMEG